MTAQHYSHDQYIVIKKQDIEELPLDINFEVESFLDEALMYLPQNDYLVWEIDKPCAGKRAKNISEVFNYLIRY